MTTVYVMETITETMRIVKPAEVEERDQGLNLKDDGKLYEGWLGVKGNKHEAKASGQCKWMFFWANLDANTLILKADPNSEDVGKMIDVERIMCVHRLHPKSFGLEEDKLVQVVQIKYYEDNLNTSTCSTTSICSSNTSWRGHQFLAVSFRMPKRCNYCNRKLNGVFSPPSAYQCNKCHLTIHKEHANESDLSNCPVSFKFKKLILMVSNQTKYGDWIKKLVNLVRHSHDAASCENKYMYDAGQIESSRKRRVTESLEPLETEQPRGLWELRKYSAVCKGPQTDPSIIITTANKIFFQLNKAAIRLKQNLSSRALQLDENYEEDDSFNHSNELSFHLSSIESPSSKSVLSSSSPVTNMGSEFLSTLCDLSADIILTIGKYLDEKSVRKLAQTCSAIRKILLSSPKNLQKRVVTRYEIILNYNCLTRSINVRALKKNRAVTDEVFIGSSLEDVVPRLVTCMAKITFGNGINVYEWRKTLLKMHYTKQLTPLALIFGGGEQSKGNQVRCGADLRNFTETEFINFVGNFYPHVQEVQLLTTRLFKTSTSPAHLLSFVPLLSFFGISYERPAVKFFFDDVKQVVTYWKHDPLSRSSTVYMRAPSGGNNIRWIDLGASVEGCTTGAHKQMEKNSEDFSEPLDKPENKEGDVLPGEHSDEEGAEIVSAIDERNEVNRFLYGSQDATVCTWPEGYKPRQPLFSCLTCKPNKDDFAGICLGCSANCHYGHDLVELYTKRKFRCDCGNDKFEADNKCNLYEEKTGVNELNTYNHNFAGTYCTCEDTFPGNSDEMMFQCLMCEDWFHLSHQDVQTDAVTEKDIKNGSTLVCKTCAEKHPYLALFEVADEKSCFTNELKEENKQNRIFTLKPDWRNRICSCPDCLRVLEAADTTFLLDEDDDLEKYEKENRERAKDISDAEMVDELVKLGGRDAAANVIKGYNELKQNLFQFFETKQDQVITPDDIHSFFSQIKRPRLDPNAEE